MARPAGSASTERTARQPSGRGTARAPANSFSSEVRVAPLVEIIVGVAHGLRARAAEHDLEIHRLEAIVDVAVDHARWTGDAFPRTKADVEAASALVLDESGQIALEDEEHLFHFMGV